MASSLIEQARALEQDLEQLVNAMSERQKVLSEPKQNVCTPLSPSPPPKHDPKKEANKFLQNRERLNLEHEIAQLMVQHQDQSARLHEIYEDKSGAYAAEVQRIGSDIGNDPMDEFYKELKEIYDHHAKYPNERFL